MNGIDKDSYNAELRELRSLVVEVEAALHSAQIYTTHVRKNYGTTVNCTIPRYDDREHRWAIRTIQKQLEHAQDLNQLMQESLNNFTHFTQK